MKRSQVIFVSAVLLTLVAGFLVERVRRVDPLAIFEFAAPRRVPLQPLELPVGEHGLAGRVLFADDRPAPDVQVTLYPAVPVAESSEPLHWAYTDANGTFSLVGLSRARYAVALVLPDHPHTQFTIDVPAAESSEEIVWHLQEPLPPIESLPEMQRADLTGNVLPPTGFTLEEYPLAGYEVVARPSEEAHPLSGAVTRRTAVAASGAFVFENLVATAYRIQVVPPWASGGTWPILEEVYLRHVLESEDGRLLSLRLRAGEIRGRLLNLDELPIEGALVKLWRRDAPDPQTGADATRLWPPAETDATGEFRFRDLPPGSYGVRVRTGEAALERTEEVREGSRLWLDLDPLDPKSASR